MSVNGDAPMLVSSGKVEYFAAAFFLRNVPGDGRAPTAADPPGALRD